MSNRTPVPAHVQEPVRMATQPQLDYIKGLIEGKDLSPLSEAQRTWCLMKLTDDTWQEETTSIPFHKASPIITELKKLDWKPREMDSKEGAEFHQLAAEVRDGRYAIPKDDGTLMFYSVKKGKYTTFVNVWASDARYPVKSLDERVRILKAIIADEDAGPRFGREIGSCYVCGRTLTDETSRALGIGPVCRGDS